jgi:hypothetical protein
MLRAVRWRCLPPTSKSSCDFGVVPAARKGPVRKNWPGGMVESQNTMTWEDSIQIGPTYICANHASRFATPHPFLGWASCSIDSNGYSRPPMRGAR